MAVATTKTMSQALFFVESHVKWKPLLRTSLVRLPKNTNYDEFNTKTSRLSIKCFCTNTHNIFNSSYKIGGNRKSIEEMKNKENPMIQILDLLAWSGLSSDGKEFPYSLEKNLGNIICKAQKGLLKAPSVAALLVGVLLLLLFLCDARMAFAASGGRMGGSSFSSGSSSSSSSSQSSSSSSGGYGYSYSGYSGGGTYSSSGSSGGSTYSSLGSSDDDTYSSSRSSGGVNKRSSGDDSVRAVADFIVGFFAALVLVFLVNMVAAAASASARTSVVKIQVGLLGTATSLQGDLNRIAETADTSSPEGFHSVLTDTIQALLQYPSHCISAFSSVDVEENMEAGEKIFTRFSIVERSKFDEETLVNVNNIKKQTATAPSASGSSNDDRYIVVTILVAIQGTYKLLDIKSSGDLKEALQKLASIPSSRTKAVEVLWTPQNENDTLSEREVRKDYPLLQPI